MNLVVHGHTRTELTRLSHDLPQSLLLYGPSGVGLLTIASSIADSDTIVINPRDKDGNSTPDGSITVEIIRSLYQQTRSKRTKRHIVIIDNADQMTHGAQNAFLKLLEEPNAATHFILTVHTLDKLLPTIKSRVQKVRIKPITTAQTKDFIAVNNPNIDATKLRQLLFIADGLPAELSRFQQDDDYFKAKVTLMTHAREFVSGTPYQKLLLANGYQTDRQKATDLLNYAQMIAYRAVQSTPSTQLIEQLSLLTTAQAQLAANYSVRLVLLRLVI